MKKDEMSREELEMIFTTVGITAIGTAMEVIQGQIPWGVQSMHDLEGEVKLSVIESIDVIMKAALTIRACCDEDLLEEVIEANTDAMTVRLNERKKSLEEED